MCLDVLIPLGIGMYQRVNSEAPRFLWCIYTIAARICASKLASASGRHRARFQTGPHMHAQVPRTLLAPWSQREDFLRRL